MDNRKYIKTVDVDLIQLGSKVFIGFGNGVDARKELKLSNSPQWLRFKNTENITCNSSFIKGFLSPELDHWGVDVFYYVDIGTLKFRVVYTGWDVVDVGRYL
jgi:hypothetical protein